MGTTTFTGDRVFTQLHDGTWMEAVPLPYYLWFGRVKCDCGKKYRSEEQYMIHYTSEHTDGKKYRRTPQGFFEINRQEE